MNDGTPATRGRRAPGYGTAAFFALLGCFLAYFPWDGVHRWREFEAEFRPNSVRAEAEVVTILEYRGRTRGGTFYTPVYRFTTADGRVVETRSSWGYSSTRDLVSQRIPVLYSAQRPEIVYPADIFDYETSLVELLWWTFFYGAALWCLWQAGSIVLWVRRARQPG